MRHQMTQHIQAGIALVTGGGQNFIVDGGMTGK